MQHRKTPRRGEESLKQKTTMKKNLGNRRLLLTANRTEALLEFVDTTFGIDELVLTCEEGVGIRGDTTGDNVMFYAINFFCLLGCCARTGDKTTTSCDVEEYYGMILGVKISFHDKINLRFRRRGGRV